MGNSPLYVHTPVEDIRNRLSDEEIDRLAILFFEFSSGDDSVNLESFLRKQKCHEYFKKDFLKKVFGLLDTQRDSLLDLDDFLCASYLFLHGGDIDRNQFLFSLYDSSHNHTLTEDNLKLMFTDANVMTNIPPSLTVKEVGGRLKASDVVLGNMAFMAVKDFSREDEGKLTFDEFHQLVAIESSLHQMLAEIPLFLNITQN